jgi:hypothetical protein
MLLVYGVGVFPFLWLKIAVLPRVLLFSSTKVVVQATNYINQVFLDVRELLNSYRVFNLCT